MADEIFIYTKNKALVSLILTRSRTGNSASFSAENSLPSAELNAPVVAFIYARFSRLRSKLASAGSIPHDNYINFKNTQ